MHVNQRLLMLIVPDDTYKKERPMTYLLFNYSLTDTRLIQETKTTVLDHVDSI